MRSSAPQGAGGDPASLLVAQWRGAGGVEVQDLRVYCEVPALQAAPRLQGAAPTYLVDDAAGLVNAIVAAQSFGGGAGASIVLRQSVSFRDLFRQQAAVQRVLLTSPIAVTGVAGGGQAVIDWNLMNWVFGLADAGTSLTFTNVTMMNLSPLRGLIAPKMGYLGWFATPFWSIW